ncbi:MAG: hypothetical protein JW944_05975, partial [Deltaproteobacteria bacterium]|nr:hypothetical protein [Deltaproteobacteria bacterium]
VMLLALHPLSTAKAGVVERNIFLTEMLSLSEKPGYYLLVKMEEKKILLMARGVVIREWVVDDCRITGDPLPIKPIVLKKKSINLDDMRIHINGADEVINNNADADDDASRDSGDKKTGKNKSGVTEKAKKYEFLAMEIDDMPTDFELYLDGGITVKVISGSKCPGILYSFKKYAYYPILALWASLNKRSFTKIDLFFMDRTEAQSLFWAFTDGKECIILPSSSENRDDFQF